MILCARRLHNDAPPPLCRVCASRAPFPMPGARGARTLRLRRGGPALPYGAPYTPAFGLMPCGSGLLQLLSDAVPGVGRRCFGAETPLRFSCDLAQG
jgi:hypothetical protein